MDPVGEKCISLNRPPTINKDFHSFIHIHCPSIIVKTIQQILTKLDTEVCGEDTPAPADFRTDSATLAPPVGHFGFRQLIHCLSIIVKTIQRILMKLDTEVMWW